MTKLILFILSIVVLWVLGYLMVGFVLFEWDPKSWSIDARAKYVLCGFILSFFAAVIANGEV